MSILDQYTSELPTLFKQEEEAAEQSSPPQRPPLKGYADIIEYHTQGLAGREIQIIPTERFLPVRKHGTKKAAPKSEQCAVVLRRTWVLRGQVSVPVRIELEIQAEPLCRAFRKIAASHYENTDLSTCPIKLRAPFEELFFYRDEIQALAESEETEPQLRDDAKALHDFVRMENGLLSSIVLDHEKYSIMGQVVSDILWTIYPPNSLVVVSVGMIRECWICRDVSISLNRKMGIYLWSIAGLRVDFDGASPGLARQTFQLPMMGLQICKISDLPIVPVEHCKDWPELKATLLARSARLHRVLGEDLSDFASQKYDGPSLSQRFSEYSDSTKPSLFAKQMDERVIVDYKMYIDRNGDSTTTLVKLGDKAKPKTSSSRGAGKQQGARAVLALPGKHCSDPTCSICIREAEGEDADFSLADFNPSQWGVPSAAAADTTRDNANSDGEAEEGAPPPISTHEANTLAAVADAVSTTFKFPREDFELLFPALVPAFGLKTKEWSWVLSDTLEDVGWSPEAFQSLQLDGRTKHLVESLVKGHKAKAATMFDDVIPGKGRGLVFLLHGEPGLGKTLTAESVADYLKRPLYSISGGELSTDVTVVEKRLNEIFELTKRWDAVVLLDEADVLLCKRTSAEMDRNAIVGVFLRMMEYFQGVLFLTTNRKQDFDEAFKSRIHVTISYPDLSDEAQSAIWRRFVTGMKVDPDGSWTEEVYDTLGKLALNGRTIKNILRTAVAYAHGDDKPLGVSHILAIVKTELREYINMDDTSSAPAEQKKRKQVVGALRELERLSAVAVWTAT